MLRKLGSTRHAGHIDDFLQKPVLALIQLHILGSVFKVGQNHSVMMAYQSVGM
jgi:hypothetical protein